MRKEKGNKPVPRKTKQTKGERTTIRSKSSQSWELGFSKKLLTDTCFAICCCMLLLIALLGT